jgi:hypothetical protein
MSIVEMPIRNKKNCFNCHFTVKLKKIYQSVDSNRIFL